MYLGDELEKDLLVVEDGNQDRNELTNEIQTGVRPPPKYGACFLPTYNMSVALAVKLVCNVPLHFK